MAVSTNRFTLFDGMPRRKIETHRLSLVALKTLVSLLNAIQHRILFNMSLMAVGAGYILLLMGAADPMTACRILMAVQADRDAILRR